MEFIFRFFHRLPIEVTLGIPALVIALLAICVLGIWSIGHNKVILLEINKAFEDIGGTPQSLKLGTFDRMATLLYLQVWRCICVLKLRYNVYQLKKEVAGTIEPEPTWRSLKGVFTVGGFMLGTVIFANAAMWYFSQLGNGLLIAHGNSPVVLEDWMYPAVTIAAILIGWLAGMAVSENRTTSTPTHP